MTLPDSEFAERINPHHHSRFELMSAICVSHRFTQQLGTESQGQQSVLFLLRARHRNLFSSHAWRWSFPSATAVRVLRRSLWLHFWCGSGLVSRSYPAEAAALQPLAGSAFWMSSGRVTGDGTKRSQSSHASWHLLPLAQALSVFPISSFTELSG